MSDSMPPLPALLTTDNLHAYARAYAEQETAAMRAQLRDQTGVELMAECMRQFREDMIRAGVIQESVPPMMMTEAILHAMAALRDTCRSALAAADAVPVPKPFAWGASTLGVTFAHVDKRRVNDWIGSDGDCDPFPLYTVAPSEPRHE